MTLQEIARMQVDQITEHMPILNRLISNQELTTLTLTVFEQVYNEQELELLLKLYSSPVGMGMLNKSGAALALSQQLTHSLIKERMENLSDEDREEFLDELREFGR
jgi:hypothetical protein